ncbi:hypothetical protein [Photobacterium sp. GB-72]|nr:hypothetical protein [Photobacterium sp. GB-72]
MNDQNFMNFLITLTIAMPVTWLFIGWFLFFGLPKLNQQLLKTRNKF